MSEHVPGVFYDVMVLADFDWLFVPDMYALCTYISEPSMEMVLVISHYYSQQVIRCYNIHQFFSICFSENEDSSLVIKEINKGESATNETWVS